jgi:hypothetical protein
VKWLSTTKYALTAVFASCFVMFAVSIIWSNHVADDAYNRAARNQQHFCALVSTLDSVYQSSPPTTVTGKRVAAEMHDLKTNLGC